MKMLLGRKIGMISSFLEDGKVIPVTVVYAEPNLVIENKTKEKNGYDATKVGFLSVDKKSISKPEFGVFEKLKLQPKKYVREFREVTGYNVGDEIKVDVFQVGDRLDCQGITKGHGFTGAIKRWNFKCGAKSHGAGYPHRYQGSISFGRGGSQAQRVMKGKKMSGHYGAELVTIHNLEVIGIDLYKNVILIKGALPGPNKGIVLLKTTNRVKNFKKSAKLVDFTQENNSSMQKSDDK